MHPKGPASRLFGALHRRNRAPVAVPLDLCCRPTAPPLQGNGAPVAAQSGPRCARFGLRFSASSATVPPKPLKHNHLHKPSQNSKIRARTNRARFFSNLSQVRAIIFQPLSFYLYLCDRVAKLLRLGKKRINSFVLLSTFRNSAIKDGELTLSRQKKKQVSLFCSRFFVTLPKN